MNNQNRIALFVDIDNMPLGKQHIDRIISRLEESGEIAYAKFYGVTDRRHRDIICDIAARGFEMAPPVTPKKRGSTKVFDNRILVDLCELVFTNTSVSSVAIVANPTNLVHLFARLKREDVGIYACDNLDDDSLAFVDEILRFGYDDPNTAAKKRAAEGERENAGAFKIVTRRDEVPSPERLLTPKTKLRKRKARRRKKRRNTKKPWAKSLPWKRSNRRKKPRTKPCTRNRKPSSRRKKRRTVKTPTSEYSKKSSG